MYWGEADASSRLALDDQGRAPKEAAWKGQPLLSHVALEMGVPGTPDSQKEIPSLGSAVKSHVVLVPG